MFYFYIFIYYWMLYLPNCLFLKLLKALHSYGTPTDDATCRFVNQTYSQVSVGL